MKAHLILVHHHILVMQEAVETIVGVKHQPSQAP